LDNKIVTKIKKHNDKTKCVNKVGKNIMLTSS
jgi:hypothetical protein